MSNPFNSGLKQSANSATAPRNAVNDPKARPRRTHNTFNRTYHHYCTQRYGDIHPFFIDDGVADDKNPLYSEHELKTFTLKSPLMTGLSMKKGYFAVPYKALLPINYDKYVVNPKYGDDVPDDVNSVVFLSASWFNNFKPSSQIDSFLSLGTCIKVLLFYELFFSHGSLLNALGYKLSSVWPANSPYSSFDKLFDVFFAELFSNTIQIEVLEDEVLRRYIYVAPDSIGDVTGSFPVSVSPHRLLEIMRQNPEFTIVQLGDDEDEININFMPFNDIISSSFGQFSFSYDTRPLNYSRLLAYQITSVVFFSNDDVDDIFTAGKFRDNMASLYFEALGDLPRFSYNGVRTPYDVLSGCCLRNVFGELLNTYLDSGIINLSCYQFIANIFDFQKSLRFADYYLGSRINPLALGDINAPVVNQNVSAINLTRSISIQRFTNFVNKIPSQLSQYLKEMFGVHPAPDLTEPSYLGVTQHNIGGFIVENNAEEQGKLVTNLVSDDGKFAFEVDIDDPCIIIGLSWFEQPRVYSSIIERNMLHVDRFDDFQPMLQYIGDQDIKQCEFHARLPYSEPFAYTLRNMEYKQRVHQATGGFVENLPSWANVVDNPSNLQEFESDYDHLNSNLIRSRNYEFDKYYESVSGFSRGSYFHFIIKYINKNEITRPMAVAPEILG